VAAPELGKKLAGLEEDARRGGGSGAGTGGHRHGGGVDAAATWARQRRRGGRAVSRPKKFVCHRVIKHPVVV
jgi:hypothetical protein